MVHNPLDFEEQYGIYSKSEEILIAERREDLRTIYQHLKEGIAKRFGEGNVGFYLNNVLIDFIVGLYVNDLKKLKKFHGVDGGTDDLRRAGILAYWVARIRPVHIRDYHTGGNSLAARDSEQLFGMALDINAIYSARVFFYFLKLSPEIYRDPEFERLSRYLIHVFAVGEPKKDLLVTLAAFAKALIRNE